jgi:hypothetical protein
MDRFEDQNVNTINIPRKNIDEKEKSIEPNSIDLTRSVPVVYKLSLQKTEDSRLPREFDELVKEIIETNNKEFLHGKQNLIEYLISKHAISDSDDLKNLTSISLKVKENFGMLNEFGQYLPNLEELILSGSVLKSVEEIGTSFMNLKILNISNCSVYDLTGTNIFF